jgi:predicted nucleic acid-binding protein
MNLINGNRYLFDTMVFIDRLRNSSAAKSIMHQVRFNNIDAGFSIITETELWYGIMGQRTEYEHKVLLRPFRRYNLNSTIARRAGVLRRILETANLSDSEVPDLADCLIASTAEYHKLVIVTRNWKHFKHFQKFAIQVERYDL